MWLAYNQGLFLMGDVDGRLGFYAVRRRCVFPPEGMHVSRSLAKTIRRGPFEVRTDTAFEATMRGCLRPPGHNWITEEMIELYVAIHRQGWAHSVEAWREGVLVGGVYGLTIGRVFCAESMFSRATDASKVALAWLFDHRDKLGIDVVDAQIINDHTRSLGAIEMPASRFLWLLKAHGAHAGAWCPEVPPRGLLRS